MLLHGIDLCLHRQLSSLNVGMSSCVPYNFCGYQKCKNQSADYMTVSPRTVHIQHLFQESSGHII